MLVHAHQEDGGKNHIHCQRCPQRVEAVVSREALPWEAALYPSYMRNHLNLRRDTVPERNVALKHSNTQRGLLLKFCGGGKTASSESSVNTPPPNPKCHSISSDGTCLCLSNQQQACTGFEVQLPYSTLLHLHLPSEWRPYLSIERIWPVLLV